MTFPTPEIRERDEHASHVASDMPDFGTETILPHTMVNGFDDHLPIAKNPDTSFACFIAGEGK